MFDNTVDCKYSESCGLHHRVNQVVADMEDFLAVEYIGDHAIVTTLTSDIEVISAMLSGQPVLDARTFVIRVGSGSIESLGSIENLNAAREHTWDIRFGPEVVEAIDNDDDEKFAEAYNDLLKLTHGENIERFKAEVLGL